MLTVLLAAAITATASNPPLVTVLPNGEALVAETIDVPAGTAGRVALPRAESLRPETVVATLGDRPLTLFFDPPLNGVAALLASCVGQAVRILPAGPQAEASGLPDRGELVAPGDPALVRLPDGGVVALRAERIVCTRPGDARTTIGLELPERSSGGAVRLRYRASGMSWEIRHRLDLDPAGTDARLASTAVIAVPAGMAFDGARLRLAEGDVPVAQQQPPQPMMKGRAMAMSSAAGGGEPEQVEESSTLDLTLFDVPGRWDLTGPGHVSIPLRPAQKIAIEDVMQVQLERWSPPTTEFQALAPRRILRFPVAGDAPLPAGVFDVGATRADGTWIPLGEARTVRVPAGRTAEVPLGEVRDVAIEYRPSSVVELRESPYQREAVFEVKVENHRDRATKIEIVHRFWSSFQLMEASLQPARTEGTSATWKFSLDPGKSQTIRYRVRVDPRPRRME